MQTVHLKTAKQWCNNSSDACICICTLWILHAHKCVAHKTSLMHANACCTCNPNSTCDILGYNNCCVFSRTHCSDGFTNVSLQYSQNRNA